MNEPPSRDRKSPFVKTKMLLKSFFRRITKDFRHKELLPLKLIFFVQASTLYVLYPYLTIHMRELGINVEETAIMSAVTPLVAIVMPPLAGMLADRIGNFRILLSLFSVLGGAASLLLLLVPIGRITVQFPERVVMDLGCSGRGGQMVYSMSQNHPCATRLRSAIDTRIESCGYACHVDEQTEADARTLLMSPVYTVNHYDLETGANSSFKYAISPNNLPKIANQKEELKEHRVLRNNELFRTSIRELSKNAFFFPASRLYEFSCVESGYVEDFETTTAVNATSNRIYENRTLCNFGRLIAPEQSNDQTANVHSYESKLTEIEASSRDREQESRRYAVNGVAWTAHGFQRVTCGNPDAYGEKVTVSVPLFNLSASPESYGTLTLGNCSKRCIVTAPRDQVCSNKDTEIEYNVRLTFWLYLVIRVFIGIIGGTTFAMFEGAVIAILREQKADYGLQRIYGSIGGMISSPLSGLLIDYASAGKSYTDFRPAFYLYAALKIVSGVLMLAINLEFKAPASNVVNDVLSVLRNIEVVALFIACFILGTAWGYIESFLFWLIQDLGGSRSLMGITITVGGIAGIPLLVLSGPIISKIGHANVLFVGFVFYAVRLFGYSLIYNPWLTLIFEALESVTSSLSFTAAVTYAAKLSTTTTDSSIQGLLGGVYYGVGKGSGSLIGGYLMKAFGTRPTYQIFAAVSLVTGLMYFFFNALYLKKRPQVEGNDIVKKKPKHAPGQNGVEAGAVEIPLDDRKRRSTHAEDRKIERIGIENEAFSKETENENQNGKSPEDVATRNIEAVNNAKNTEKIEKSRAEDLDRDRRASCKSDERKQTGSERNRPDDEKRVEEGNGRAGLSNPTFESSDEDEDECDVVVERPPEVYGN